MRVLVTGADGMLGTALQSKCPDDVEFLSTDVQELDITDSESVELGLDLYQPGLVINAAAYTDVDGCETNEELALEVNGAGAGRLARLCAASGIPLLHMSTDYVFDGRIPAPGQYTEEDQTAPLSAYGRSKLAGEHAVQAAGGPHWIVRTQWLYGLGGKNFVETMLRLGAERDRLGVVDDQVGSPTSAYDLAPLLWRIIQRQPDHGIYHAANAGSCSWFEFAREIFRQAGMAVTVEPTKTADLARPAPRPARGVLCTAKLRSALHIDIPAWQDALRRYLARRAALETNA